MSNLQVIRKMLQRVQLLMAQSKLYNLVFILYIQPGEILTLIWDIVTNLLYHTFFSTTSFSLERNK